MYNIMDLYQSMECLGQKIQRFCKIVAGHLSMVRMLTKSKIL